MTDELYRQAILAKAKEAVGAGNLDEPDARVTVDNPICGDRIVMEIRVADGKITALAHNVRGCVLCRAAASLIGANAVGSDRQAADAAFEAAATMLKGTGTPPASGPWSDLVIFAPVADQKSRHHCVLLPFEALRRALDEAGPTAS